MTSKLEDLLEYQIKAFKLPAPEREYRFHPTRRWRLDFAWPELKFACEVEGGIYTGGRHVRPKGFEADLEKYGEAMKLGWDVYRCSARMVRTGEAVGMIEQMIKAKRGQ